MTALLWAVEFILEACGAYLYFRRSKITSFLLGVCAIGDLLTYAVFQTFSRDTYAWSFWIFYAIKYLLLIWLGCAICGMFVREQRKSFAILSSAFMSLGSAAIVMAVGSSGETLKNSLLEGEVTANFILLSFVAVGWISRREKLNQAWKFIAAGFMVMVGSDLLFTALWMGWDGARHLYPIGAISAQILWCVGPLKTVKLGEFRKSLEQKFPEVEKVTVI